MTTAFRRCLRYGRVAAHVATAVVKVGLCWRRWPSQRRRHEVQAWSAVALEIFGFTCKVSGRLSPADGRGVLIVANHVSWLDIYALLAQVDAHFVAKSEVRRWPAIGWLGAQLGTVFIDRERRGALPHCIATVSGVLAGGRHVVLFPEGTTSDGRGVLPFHPPLFEVAIRAGTEVQPVAVSYRRSDGRPATEAAFTGDMSLLQSFARLAEFRGGSVEIALLEPFSARGQTRAALAARAEQSVRDYLSGNQAGVQERLLIAA